MSAVASARRHRILKDIGVEFEIFVPDCNEINDDSDPVKTVCTNALAKHDACRELKPDAWILAADTVVVLRGRIMEKPAGAEGAREMLRSLSGQGSPSSLAAAR